MTEKKLEVSVLYVEDELSTRQAVGEMLQRRIENLLMAGNGKEGLDLFKKNMPDMVITDIKMPIMDGLSMARQIKELDRNTQIIVTTAHSDIEYLLEAIDIGIDQYVLKPINNDKLFAAALKSASIVGMEKDARRHNEERERLIAELQEAIAKVRQLSGLLPICAGCKKIRDDKGYWNQLESYISEHSEAEFSHGICPECMKRLYPEYCKDKE
jgi:YesN/AraC family two-component response regulator